MWLGLDIQPLGSNLALGEGPAEACLPGTTSQKSTTAWAVAAAAVALRLMMSALLCLLCCQYLPKKSGYEPVLTGGSLGPSIGPAISAGVDLVVDRPLAGFPFPRPRMRIGVPKQLACS